MSFLVIFAYQRKHCRYSYEKYQVTKTGPKKDAIFNGFWGRDDS
jgi:hypothetical protein